MNILYKYLRSTIALPIILVLLLGYLMFAALEWAFSFIGFVHEITGDYLAKRLEATVKWSVDE